MKNKPTKTKAKQKAWASFSIYIRTRDTIPTWPDRRGQCVTCGGQKEFKKLQAGHFIPGRHGSVLFNEDIVHAQCLTDDSSLRMFNGKYENISKVKVGYKLWGFDENTFQKKPCIITAVQNFIPDELYEIELENGKKFYATPDHRIVVNGKWAYIKDILHSMSTSDMLEL